MEIEVWRGTMSSFISDERAIVEPHVDMPAMALAVVGFIVFIAIMSQAYGAYQNNAFIAENYQDASKLAEKLSRESTLTGSMRLDVIDAVRFESVGNDPKELMQKYGAYYNFVLKVEVDTKSRTYVRIIKDPDITVSKYGISSSIPVTVRFNDVQELPGTLTVKIWRK
jgi:Ni,Fe-hydrogenase III component G